MLQNKRTYRKRLSYNTRSNKVKNIRTPGGKLVVRYLKKPGSINKCGECSKELEGLKKTRPAERSRLKKHQRTVSRAFGGNICGKCLKNRILRCFLSKELREKS